MSIPYGEGLSAGRAYIDLSDDIVAVILSTIERGWQIASLRQEVHSGAFEVPITECLRDGMREAVINSGPENLIVAPGTESRSQSYLTTPDGRTDIPLYLIEIFVGLKEHDPHAIIECKRVVGGDAHLAREYVVEGINRFQKGKYGSNHSTGFMAGYVMAGEPTSVVDSINAYLTRKARRPECLVQSNIMADSSTWQSQHDRLQTSKPIGLHHAMLKVPFTSSPN